MELQEFIQNFADAIEIEVTSINGSTEFHDLEEWTSMAALMIIGMIDDEYEVQLKAEEMRGADTIEDLFEIVKSKID